jgi:hypothetical protein
VETRDPREKVEEEAATKETSAVQEDGVVNEAE